MTTLSDLFLATCTKLESARANAGIPNLGFTFDADGTAFVIRDQRTTTSAHAHLAMVANLTETAQALGTLITQHPTVGRVRRSDGTPFFALHTFANGFQMTIGGYGPASGMPPRHDAYTLAKALNAAAAAPDAPYEHLAITEETIGSAVGQGLAPRAALNALWPAFVRSNQGTHIPAYWAPASVAQAMDCTGPILIQRNEDGWAGRVWESQAENQRTVLHVWSHIGALGGGVVQFWQPAPGQALDGIKKPEFSLLSKPDAA